MAQLCELANALEGALAQVRYQVDYTPWPMTPPITPLAANFFNRVVHAYKQGRAMYDASIVGSLPGDVPTAISTQGYTAETLRAVQYAQVFVPGVPFSLTHFGTQTIPERRLTVKDSHIQCQADQLCDEMNDLFGERFNQPRGSGRTQWLKSAKGNYTFTLWLSVTFVGKQ